MRRISLLPLASYAALLAYACYGAVVVGHWPYYAHPDPKELPVQVLLHIATIIMLMGVLSVLLLPIVYAAWRLVMRLQHRPVLQDSVWVWVYVAGAIAWIIDFSALHGKMPWHSVISWILD